MNGSTDPGTEVELTTEDLHALSDSSRSTATNISTWAAPQAATRQRPSIPRLALGLIVTAGLVSAAYSLITSDFARQSVANISSAKAQPTAPAATVNKPVRYANPFDTQEVFEFPPGTSETEAREAVAQLLLERAKSRQAT